MLLAIEWQQANSGLQPFVARGEAKGSMRRWPADADVTGHCWSKKQPGGHSMLAETAASTETCVRAKKNMCVRCGIVLARKKFSSLLTGDLLASEQQ